MKKLFTSESVTEGHPDKICDQISDAIVDAILKEDPMGRIAAETTVNTGYAMIMGEITTNCYVDIPKIAREVIIDIGYNKSDYGFDGSTCAIMTSIDEQSKDIAIGVNHAADGASGDESLDVGAGDQGLMFGYACDETPELMPLPITLAHRLAMQLTKVRKDGTLGYLRPDGKTQVTIEYEDGAPKRIDTILISTQHNPEVSLNDIKRGLKKEVIIPTIEKYNAEAARGFVLAEEVEELKKHKIMKLEIDEETKILINPTGRFVIGGPHGDSGLTGRKIIVDTYGGYARHGGGAFSGKDPTKVDRSASYAARYVAKNIIAAGLAEKCEVQLSYAIGMAEPTSISVESFGTGKFDDENLAEIVKKVFDLRPGAIIRDLGLRNPIYRQTAAYGHFGRNDIDLPWERLDRVSEIIKGAK
ncbi:MAG: methionine adenosyltransferase [Anaerovoracaceae bacterium]